jgi:phosphatidylglycerophosphate synthase
MISKLLNHRLDSAILPVSRFLGWLGVTPNSMTVAGAVTSAIAAVTLTFGHFRVGGVLVLLGGLFDLLDGALARNVGQQSEFGAVLDSTLDRYSDILPILGLMLFYSGWTRNSSLQFGGMILCGVVILGSLLVPYVRARAERFIEKCNVGVAERAERLIIFAGGLILNADILALWILAILTHLTVFHRLWYARVQLRREDESADHVQRPDGTKLVASDVKSKI